MTSGHLSLFPSGLMPLPWWGYIVMALVLTHVTIAAVTIYLHRGQAHHGLELHPVISHFFRFWLAHHGDGDQGWVAIHRKHHAKVKPRRPHSRSRAASGKSFGKAPSYTATSQELRDAAKYGRGTPDDWVERNVYAPFPGGLRADADRRCHAVRAYRRDDLGGADDVDPDHTAGIVCRSLWGYRNFSCEDASRNIIREGHLIGGEELHNNHHAYVTSAKLSSQWYELDLGWIYIRAGARPRDGA
jgi:stearoyl-CoA desaturase (delta-9 desaturase)